MKNSRAIVKMYRQGLGDCFLVRLPRKGRRAFHMLIDCGVILGTPEAREKMSEVVDDIAQTTQGRIDVLVVTHEHWDHLSGFVQVADWQKRFDIGEVWMGWTEDPKDELARELREQKTIALQALRAAEQRMRLDGIPLSEDIAGLLGLFGATGAGTTEQALEKVRKLAGGNIRYCRPSDAPVVVEGTRDIRIYVLGPPHEEKAIKRYAPSKAHPETYELSREYDRFRIDLDGVGAAVSGEDDAPFGNHWCIPMLEAQQMQFFRETYWGDARVPPENGAAAFLGTDQSWRRIDSDWLDLASSLALKLDSATNNTSLVLAIELGASEDADTLLFAADAQVGNWLSWEGVSWVIPGRKRARPAGDAGGRKVSAHDLIRRALLYKVGHHGSHNATLREKGLELMENDRLIAMVPVDHQMANKKGWGKIPLPGLMERLATKARGRVLRIDEGAPGDADLAGFLKPAERRSFLRNLRETELFFEITL